MRHNLATQGAEFPDDACFLEVEDKVPFNIGEGDTSYDSDGDFNYDKHLRWAEEARLFGKLY